MGADCTLLLATVRKVLRSMAPTEEMVVEPSSGTDVCDARANLFLDVATPGSGSREFEFRTITSIVEMFEDGDFGPGARGQAVFATGGPLIIVAEITPEAVAAGILHYLAIEQGEIMP